MKTGQNDEVQTPTALYDDIRRIFGFDFDPAPLVRPPGFDGLVRTTQWGKCNFVNPPFSNISAWVQRGLLSKSPCVFLIPARTNAKYWSDFIWPNAQMLYFFEQRIAFEGYKKSEQFPTPMLLVLFGFTTEPPVLSTIGGLPVRTVRIVH